MAALVVDDVVPFADWPAAARAALAFLHRTVGLDVWLVTRLEQPRQVVLYAHPEEVLPPGTWISWDRSFCHSMVSGVGPRVATVAAATPAYRDLETGLPQRVAAYMGVPLVTADGVLFGTLCGLSVRAQPRALSRHLPLVEMTARMLSTLLSEEEAAQRAASSSAEPMRDRPT
ncbi:GAF domain-containing protein [Modestobacter versicolor]|uniref:GAF domain-containing protein n=1 Tax=Modestobacter versicolor TaxID=429133 RepID=A0A323VDQ8_9ACTN|nr:GAF domain-containing protein [Modestobacter versicolor]MBB3675826.1 GAF domain-containing protein [Modestobacter versicolor]PZA22857.1 histidine kinase [Modestobacter versicolor]